MAHPPIHFIISAPRSGSTWLTKSLNVHPDIFATEQRLFGDFIDVWSDRRGGTALKITQDAYVRNLAGHYFFEELNLGKREFIGELQEFLIEQLTQFALSRTGKKILVDKITPYTGTAQKVLRTIRQKLPQAKIIQLVRDGRDVATSGTFDWLRLNATGTERYDFFVEQIPGMQLNRFFDDDAIEQWATDWRDVALLFEKTAPDLQIRYETMKTELESELQNIFKLLEIDASPVVAETCLKATTFHQLTGRRAGDERPLEKTRKGIIGDWKNYFTRQDGQRFNEIAGDALHRLGYVSDNTWIDALPERLTLSNPAV